MIFHTDACQAPAWIDVNMEKLHVDMLSLDASKFYGPKGIGILVKRRSVVLEPQLDGGGAHFLSLACAACGHPFRDDCAARCFRLLAAAAGR